VWVLEILENPGILFWHFPGLENPGKLMQVLESPGILFWHFPGLENPGKLMQVLESPGKSWKFINSCNKVFFKSKLSAIYFWISTS